MSSLHDLPSEITNCISNIQQLKQAIVSGNVSIETPDLLRSIKTYLNSQLLPQDTVPDVISECRDQGDIESLRKQFTDTSIWEQHVRTSLNKLSDYLESDVLAFPHFDINRPIGEGGYGQVYEVQHKLVNRKFAIKVFSPFGGGGEVDMMRFFQEADMLFHLNHPNIVRVFEVSIAGRRPYLVMEYLPGEDLNRLLVNRGRLDAGEVWARVAAVLSGLQYAHDSGIIHRDLKPSNIIAVGPSDTKIIDFGLGIYIEQALETRITTNSGQPAGGPYTAPELRRDPKLIDSRSDIFSLGAVWFELLSGIAPGGSNLAATLRTIAGLSRTHQEAILRCLENVDNRFQSCKDVLDFVEQEEDDATELYEASDLQDKL